MQQKAITPTLLTKRKDAYHVTGKQERLVYIDNLRLMMIVLVVVQHLAVTYSGYGSWYYKEGAPLGLLSGILFGFWLSLNQGYFMGLLFLIAGYFVPISYDRKGFSRFMADRFVRLCVPALIYMLAINPFILYAQLGVPWLRPKPEFPAYYTSYIMSLDFLGGTGPLWFAVALFIFSAMWAFMRSVLPTSHSRPAMKVETKGAIILIGVIALFAFLIRTVQPIGTSVLNMQLCYFAQYVVLFIVGTTASRYDLFASLNWETGSKWLRDGLRWGFLSWSILMLAGGALEGMDALNGGVTWQSAAFSLWESSVAIAMSIGLLSLFKHRFNRQSQAVRLLSDSAFTVYVFHSPIIIALSMALRSLALPPIAKFLTLCAISLPVCFAVAHFLIRRIPLLNRVV